MSNIAVCGFSAPLDLVGEMENIFRHVEQFASVERLHLEVCGAKMLDPGGYIRFDIPLRMLPSARHVKIESNRHVQIMKGMDFNNDDEDRNSGGGRRCRQKSRWC